MNNTGITKYFQFSVMKEKEATLETVKNYLLLATGVFTTVILLNAIVNIYITFSAGQPEILRNLFMPFLTLVIAYNVNTTLSKWNGEKNQMLNVIFYGFPSILLFLLIGLTALLNYLKISVFYIFQQNILLGIGMMLVMSGAVLSLVVCIFARRHYKQFQKQSA